MGVVARGQATVNIAEPGDSPVIRSLVPTPTSVGRSEAGVCAPVSASCRLRLTVGSESEIVGVDKPIEYRGRNLCKGSSGTETTVVQNYSPYLSTGIHKEEMLTVSFWIRGDVTGILSAYVNDDSGANNAYCDFSNVGVTTDYVHHTITAKAMIGTGVWVSNLCMRLYSSNPDFKFYVKGYKLERGTKATPWSPAPEDHALTLNGNPYTAGANYTIKPTDTELLWAGSLAGASINPVRVPIIKDGATGGRGIQGIKGVDGTQYYTWIRYSDNANGVPNDNDSTRPYIGIAVNKLTATESDIASDYRWSKITGDKGIKGDKGLDGKQLYTWMKYADTAQGSGLSDSAVGKSYIGFAYNKPTATESATPSDYMWSKIKGEVGATGDSVTGKMLYRDPEFRKGVNGCYLYNNSSNGKVTLSRIPKPADCPTTSTHCLEIRVTGAASPGHGGFHQFIQSRANAVFLQKIVAKVPVGYELNTASNAMGDGCTDGFITPRVGTGKYETYLRKTVCGTTGAFNGGGHVYLTGSPLPTPANPLVWQIASCTCYDLTDSEKYDDAIEQAQADADRANAELSMIASDSKFTPSEKQQTAIEWGRIQLEQAKNTATATTLNVPTGDIVMVFNTLNGYITPLLSNLSTTSDINGGQFRSTFAAWYEKNVALVNAISVANADKAADGVERDNRNLIKDSEYRPFGANNVGTGTPTLMKDESEWYQRAVADAGKEISLYGGAASLIAGNTYTMSVYLRQNSGVDESVFLGNNIDFINTSFNLPSGVWTRVTLPPWKSTVTGRVYLIVICNSSALDYKRCKTERGTKATPWSPAPEDTAAAITAAQQAAEAYAKAQAEAAQVTASAYADGIVTAEEQRAIADATAKADAAKKAAIEAADAASKGYTDLKTGKSYTIDTSSLDPNTYYPVTMGINIFPRTEITVSADLGMSGVPPWASHTSGFMCRARWSVFGSGWGCTQPDRLISEYQQNFIKDSKAPIGSIGQNTESSTEYIYLRGGGRYTFVTTNNAEPTLHTTDFVPSYGDPVPLKTTIEQPVPDIKLVQDAAAKAIADAAAAVADYNAKFAAQQSQIDGEVSNWFYDHTPTATNAPANTWTTDTERARHIGDTFTNTQLYPAADAGKSWRYTTGYLWTPISDSDAVKALQEAARAQATADGKSTTYTALPSKYAYGDTWVLESDTVHSPNKQGELLFASQDSGSYNPAHWITKVRYTDDTTANNAKNRLDTWADDAQIAPGEKTALKQQQANIAAEYVEVSANATRYGVACTAYTTAYNAAYSALTKYTAPAPECITIEADYANIAAYYNARKTILEAIAVAIKKLQEDAITATSAATKDALAKELGYTNYAAMQTEAAKGKTLIDGAHIRTSLIDVDNLIAKQVDVVNGTSRVKITPKNGMELLENNVQTATFSGRQITSISEMMPTSPNISIGEQSVTAEVNPAARSVVMSAGVVAQTTTNVSVEIPAITLYCTIDCLSNEVPTGLTCSVGLEVNGTTQWLEFPTKRFSEMMGDFKYGLAQREQKSIPAQIITVPATPFIGKYSAINVNLKYKFIYAAPNPVTASWRIGVYAKFEGNPPADPCTTRYLKVGGATFNAAFFGNGVLFSKAIDQYVGMSATATGTELIARSGKFGIKVDKTGVAHLDENGNWDNSMILVAAHMYHSGRIVSQCGVRRLIQGSQTSQGYYQITHKIGHTNYYVQATICDPSEWRASTIRVYAKTVDSFKVAITDSTTPNTGVGQEFDLLIYGKLQ